MTDILAQIVATKQQEVAAAQQKTPLAAIRRDAESRTQTRDFAGAIRQKITQGQAAVIAEIKKASPSKGLIRADFIPADIAQSYTEGNGKTSAACLSVLTDKTILSRLQRLPQTSPRQLPPARTTQRLHD